MSPTGSCFRRLFPLLLLLVTACDRPGEGTEGEEGSGEEDEEESFTPIPVEAATVESADLYRVVTGSTTLNSARQVDAVAEVAGSVREVRVEAGDSVEEGQVLARVVNDDVRISIEEARQIVDRNEREVERLRPLFDQGFLAAQTFQTTQDQLQTARTSLRRLRSQGASQTVRAAISGVVTRRDVEAGAVVMPNQVLFSITVLDALEARIAVPERELGQLRVGQPAQVMVEAYEGQAFSGAVTRIDPVVDPQTGTVEVRVGLSEIVGENGERLRPGMFSGVRIITDTRAGVPAVPKRALIREAGTHYVFLIGAAAERPETEGSGEPTGLDALSPFTVERVEVNLGYEDQDRVEVGELAIGDRVVVVGQNGLDTDSIVVIPRDQDGQDE
ncbi:MAG: RND family efflux transporter MFP subunit [Bradymonadia bacterium]|jgi:RND family efflux transporter MFP subunit